MTEFESREILEANDFLVLRRVNPGIASGTDHMLPTLSGTHPIRPLWVRFFDSPVSRH
jgi:hypothetical protein